jgi:hypothetical protein
MKPLLTIPIKVQYNLKPYTSRQGARMGEKADKRDTIRDFDDVLLHIGGWNRYQAKLTDL